MYLDAGRNRGIWSFCQYEQDAADRRDQRGECVGGDAVGGDIVADRLHAARIIADALQRKSERRARNIDDRDVTQRRKEQIR